MKNEFSIVMVEDVPADAELVERELRRAGLSFRFARVETKDGFLQELEQGPPDLILSDHGLPSFDGFTALGLAQDRCPGTPFIFVTGAMGEERTIETFERGATDYVLKHQLFKLAPIAKRAVQAAEERLRYKLVEEDLHYLIEDLMDSLSKVKTVSGLLPLCSGCNRVRAKDGAWKTLEVYLKEQCDAEVTHEICPLCHEKAPLDSPHDER